MLWFFVAVLAFRNVHSRFSEDGIFHSNLKKEFHSKLPKVHILQSGLSINKLNNHSLEFKLFDWLNNSYVGKVSESDCSSDSLFFIFIDISSTKLPNNAWEKTLDTDLQFAAKTLSSCAFQLDRVVMPVFGGQNYNRNAEPTIRNFLDIRLLRPDNDWTTNGRDVFIPYDVFAFNNYTSNLPPKRSKYLLSVSCRESENNLDSARNWSNKLFHLWKNVPNSVVSQNTLNEDFFDMYRESDFCLILPSNTSSSIELYKAVFAECVPVIFLSFRSQLPFARLLDWSKFSIVVAKDIINSTEGMNDLLLLLQRIRLDSVLLTAYKTAVREVAVLFDYTKIDWPSVYHLILLELALSRQCGRVEKGSVFDTYQQTNKSAAASHLKSYMC
jgi:hypothetical protein